METLSHSATNPKKKMHLEQKTLFAVHLFCVHFFIRHRGKNSNLKKYTAGNQHFPSQGTFEDYFAFLKMGYGSCLEGKCFFGILPFFSIIEAQEKNTAYLILNFSFCLVVFSMFFLTT